MKAEFNGAQSWVFTASPPPPLPPCSRAQNSEVQEAGKSVYLRSKKQAWRALRGKAETAEFTGI